MPNVLDANGLQIKTVDEVISELLDGGDGFTGLRGIFGVDIQVDPNSPDGNMVRLFAQAATDYAEVLNKAYASFDPDQADGVNLDSRCTINGVYRKAGSYTTQLVTVTADQATTIPGLNASADNPFTIADASGNQFQLVVSYTFAGAGTANLTFRAAEIGAIAVASNSLTVIVTPTLGISAVTNGTLAGSIGADEETDYQLRIRRSKSTALPSKGYLQGLEGGLLSIAGTTDAKVFENTDNTTDANGVPAHGIWCVVAGGSDMDIATVIYNKRNFGPPMKGGVSVAITQVDNSIFTVKFDRPTPENLWININVAAISGPAIDPVYLRAQIIASLSYNINQPADASAITALIKAIYPWASVSVCEVSNDGVTYVALLNNAAVNNQWSIDSTRIYINGAHG